MLKDNEGRGHVLVTGGAGYVGAVLVPQLLEEGYRVTVLDILLFGPEPLAPVRDHPLLTVIRGDVRDADLLRSVLSDGVDAVIHLAAISNDPSAELAPEVTRGVNGDATATLMRLAKECGIKRFLYASSASVYGIKDTTDVTEELPLEPITLYAQCKAEGEDVLNALVDDGFVGVSVRAATVCGNSPRLRLDLTINLLTDQALRQGWMRLFGGDQMRPNIHLLDLCAFYRRLLKADAAVINGQAFNVCRSNASVRGLAEMIRGALDPGLEIRAEPTDDLRSYHLSGGKAERELGFKAERDLELAVRELQERYQAPHSPDHGDAWYRNVKWMKEHEELWK